MLAYLYTHNKLSAEEFKKLRVSEDKKTSLTVTFTKIKYLGVLSDPGGQRPVFRKWKEIDERK